MNITPLRTAALSCAAFILLAVGASHASAQVAVGIQVGAPPPPLPAPYHRWAAPYPGAVWIAPYNHWNGNRWVYVGGYYAYPPRRGAVWVSPRYYHHRYYGGYWR